MYRLPSPLLLLALAALPLPARASSDRVAEASSGKAPDPGDLVLFPLDDVSIPWRDNLKVTLVRPKKYAGNPVMAAGPIEGPDGYGAKFYGTVIQEDGKFRMWYDAMPRTDSRIPGDAAVMKNYGPVAYAESEDGIHWRRPDLGLVEFRGSRHNNLVLIEPANEPYSRAIYTIGVICDRADPDPNRRYKMAYDMRDEARREEDTATAVSPDGLRWRLINTAGITKGHFENMSLIRFDGLYYLAGQNLPPHDAEDLDGTPLGRVMKVFFSPDFLHWSNGRALAFYRSDYRLMPLHFGQETHMGSAVWNRGNVVLALYGRWHGNTLIANRHQDAPYIPPDRLRLQGTEVGLKGLTIDLGLVVSNDAIHYREPVRNYVIIPYGGRGEWDYDAILQGNGFANTATETYIWYGHSAIPDGNLPPLPTPLPPGVKPLGIGLVTLPRDRFGYFTKLLAESQERNPAYNAKRDASCLTTRLQLSRPSRLYLNVADVSPDAPLRIALVDDAERPLEGYTAECGAPSLKGPLAWSGGQPELPTATSFRIKVIWPLGVDNAKLYALYIEHE